MERTNITSPQPYRIDFIKENSSLFTWKFQEWMRGRDFSQDAQWLHGWFRLEKQVIHIYVRLIIPYCIYMFSWSHSKNTGQASAEFILLLSKWRKILYIEFSKTQGEKKVCFYKFKLSTGEKSKHTQEKKAERAASWAQNIGSNSACSNVL